MAVVTRIQSIEQSFSLVVGDILSPQAQGKAVADRARAILAEAQQQNAQALGRVPSHRQFVDGSEGKPLEQVRPNGGRIVFDFDVGEDIVGAILAELRARSPVASGDYQKSHQAFADGRQILAGEPVPKAGEYVFLNPLPYSRKIELGKMKMRVAGTDRVYQQVEQVAQRRFGNIATIKFTYQAPAGAARSKKAARAARVPALLVIMR